jgi:hypothetical protein
MEGLNMCRQPWQSLVVVTSVKFCPLVLGLSTVGETDTFLLKTSSIEFDINFSIYFTLTCFDRCRSSSEGYFSLYISTIELAF